MLESQDTGTHQFVNRQFRSAHGIVMENIRNEEKLV